MKREPLRYLRSKKEIEAISSDLRLRIVHAFRDGEASIAELARLLGRSPHSLYHHIKKLIDAGIVRETHKRRVGKRDEAVYDVTAEGFEIEHEASSRASRESLAKLARTILRGTDRDFERAIEQRLVVKSGSQANTWAGRSDARLTKAEFAAVREHLDAISRIFAQASGDKRSTAFSWTTILFPTPAKEGKP